MTRSWATTRGIALVALASSLLLFPEPCRACSCVARTPSELFDAAELIAHGRVSQVRPGPRDVHGMDTTRATVRLDTIWKGPTVSEVTVEGGYESGCYVAFTEGAEYVIFGTDIERDVLATDLCAGTGLYRRADATAAFGPGTDVPDDAPVLQAPAISESEDDGMSALQLGGIMLLAA